MRCPYCGKNVRMGETTCSSCGAPIQQQANEQATQLALSSGIALGGEARRARMNADYSDEALISPRSYNAILVGTLLWGLLVNAILCVTVGDVYRFINPFLFLALYLVLAFVGIRVAVKSHNPLISFLGYNMIVVPFGLVISSMVASYGGISSAVVTNAFVYTLLITLGMLGAAMAFPEIFAKLGGALAACLLGMLLCEIVLLLLGRAQSATDWIVAGIFSLYIGYDIYRSQRFPMTVDNAVDSALDLYLDIANLFLRLLRIMSRSKRND